MYGLSVCDPLDLLFCLVRRHGPDGYLLVVAISGPLSFHSSPSSLQVALLSLLIDSFIFLPINPWSIAETVKSRCSIPSLWTISRAISPLTRRYVLSEKHLWLASRVISPSWRYSLSDNHETIAIDTLEDQSHDRSRDKFVTIYTTSYNLIYPESMSDMNEGESGRKRKTSEGESGKFYLLLSSSTITPLNNPFCFELCYHFLSLSYSPTGNEEEKKGGERKRRNTETMETEEEEVTEVEERELLGGKRFRSIYAWLERANLFKTDLSALIPEIDALLRASYLYLNSMPRRHFSKTMPYQLLNHLFILYLSSAGTMVTPYSLQIIPDDAELKEEEDQPVGERSERRRRTKRKTMEELTPEGQAARRAALIAKRCRKRLRLSERKAAEKELETANSEQLGRSEGTSLPVPIKSGVFPKDLEAAGPSTGRKAGKSKRKAQKANGSKNPAPKNKPDAVHSGAFEGKGKSRLKKKDNSHPSAHHPSKIVVSVKTGKATKGDLLAVTKALIEAKLSQQGPVDGAPLTQIRETSLEEGKVVVKVWDKASKDFAIKAVNKGGQYKAVAQEGRLRMAFTVTALFADTPPESLMALLLRQNPGLPSGALLFVSRVRSSGGGWSIFVDVDRRGLGYLRGRGNMLSALMEMVHLRPAEK